MNASITAKIMGGFGNQLFCYACGYAVAKSSNRQLRIDTSQQDNDTFRSVDIVKLNITYDDRITFKRGARFLDRAIINKAKLIKRVGISTKYIKEKKYYTYQNDIFEIKKRNVYLDGYWQSYKYFEKYRADFLEMFTPKINLVVKKIEDDQNVKVAIHIRRGDYINIGCNIGLNYYDSAINYLKDKLGNDVKYYVFSDDVDFAKTFIKRYPGLNMRVAENNSENQTLEDFYLMTSCDHFIIANSSFSWWAAWLGKKEAKIVVCPEVDFWTGDFYPDEWVKISASMNHKEEIS